MLANYKEEQAAFVQLCEPHCQVPILLLRGKSDYGKSTLLETCRQIVKKEKVFYVHVDCTRPGINPAEIFSRTADHTNRDRLPAFTKYLRQHNVEISGNQIEGESNQINVLLGTDSEQARKETARLADQCLA